MENLHLLPDETLISYFQQGDNMAFDVLINRYSPSLYSYVFFVLKSKDAAEDILQETFLKVITTVRKGKYRDDGKFQCWITRIAHNCIVDYYRCEKDEQKVLKDNLSHDLFNNQKFSEENTEQKIIRQQIYKNVKKMIRFLPDSQREIIWLRYYKGLSFKEIAGITGVSINTALGRMRYAVLNMRKMVQEHTTLVTL